MIVLNESTIKSRCRPLKSPPEITLSSPVVAAGNHVVVPGSRRRKSRCRPRKSPPEITLLSPEVAAGNHVNILN